MEPKNGGLEDDVPFQIGDFQVPAVSFCTGTSKFWHRKDSRLKTAKFESCLDDSIFLEC